jgi:hypothetical protein
MAARKPSAKPEAAAAEGTVPDPTVPGLDPELARIRDEARAAEPAVKIPTHDEPGIDPLLVEAREKALKAEADYKRRLLES